MRVLFLATAAIAVFTGWTGVFAEDAARPKRALKVGDPSDAQQIAPALSDRDCPAGQTCRQSGNQSGVRPTVRSLLEQSPSYGRLPGAKD